MLDSGGSLQFIAAKAPGEENNYKFDLVLSLDARPFLSISL